MELFKKIDKYCRDSGIASLLDGCRHVIVGFSGGADSTVLISYLASLREKKPDLTVVAAHVNHMIRGAEADRDEAFCKELCSRLAIPFEVKKANVPEIAKKEGKTLEEAARDVRYAFFSGLCEKYEGALVATAHNADDNLETVIFHLTRGSGTKGLSGIAPVRDGRYIRPLLSCSSEEIRAFARSNGINYVTDSTNADTVYTRNSIRHEVLPVLRKINPQVHAAALRLSSAAREDCEFIETEAQCFLKTAPTRERMKALPHAVLQRVISLMYKKKAGVGLDLSEKNIADCKKLLENPEGGRVSLPHSLSFFADKYRVAVEDEGIEETLKEALSPAALKIGEEAKFGSFYIICTETTDYVNTTEENIYNLSLHAHLDCDKISGDIRVRNRMSGDTFRYRKINRKLKKLLCDENVPTHLRDSLPILVDSEGILLVPMIGARDGCSPSKDSKRLLHVHIFKK